MWPVWLFFLKEFIALYYWYIQLFTRKILDIHSWIIMIFYFKKLMVKVSIYIIIRYNVYTFLLKKTKKNPLPRI